MHHDLNRERQTEKSNAGRKDRREAGREAEGGGGAVKSPSPAPGTQRGAASTSSCRPGAQAEAARRQRL